VTKLVFDLDGTLVDSVYQHVSAWHAAFRRCGWEFPVYKLHRKIGMSGRVLISALSRALSRECPDAERDELERIHEAEYQTLLESVRPLPGARALLVALHELGVDFAIVTSSGKKMAGELISKLDLPFDIPLVTKDDTDKHKPDPSGFLIGASKIGAQPTDAMVVGDSVWDMLGAVRAKFLGVGLLSGGYGEEELTGAGAFRVYADPAEIHARLNELGIDAE